MLLILCTLKVAASFTIPFSVNPAMFGTLRFLEGMSSLAFYQLSFVIGKNNVMKNSDGSLFFGDFSSLWLRNFHSEQLNTIFCVS